ncbi:MAG TPA: DUF370 domain-containing protein [Clostridiales bacterium]|jgi:hypothetical protein|nr:DUF370 domain-containing protein [Clostridiales bacterium]
MYLYLGEEKLLPTRGIVGLFDLDTATVGHSTRNFLKKRRNQTKAVSAELPKGFVLENTGGEDRVWLTALTGETLNGRFKYAP